MLDDYTPGQGRRKSVAVAAHPDDEVMWWGGLIVSQPGDWTIICLSVPRADPIRSWKFFDACERLGARGRLFPATEPSVAEGVDMWSIVDLLHLQPYDRIVTHGIEGEYGHAHHVAVSSRIHEKWGHKEIWSRVPPGLGGHDIEVQLEPVQADAKLAALQAYDHVLPYEGVPMTKWEALLKRYYDGGQHGGWIFGVERYRIGGADKQPRLPL